VVLLLVDTLRADRLPFYGCPENTAPFLNDLANRSLVFENVWSPSSWTLPATVSILTSVHPFQHGVTDLVGLELEPGEEPVAVNCIPDEVETLAESLQDAGYSTYGVASNILVGREVGFDRGFDRFVQLPDEDADAVNAQIEVWREEIVLSEPYFLYLHYFDPHDPFHARDPWFDLESSSAVRGWPEEYDLSNEGLFGWLDWIVTRLEPRPDWLQERKAEDLSTAEIEDLLSWMKAAYDSEIGFVDSRIQEVFESLNLDQAIVVFSADHGEEFLEHGFLTHGGNLYGESVRVPLLLHLPDDRSGQRIQTPCSTLDILPTLRKLLQLPPLPQAVGVNLLDERGERPILSILEGKSGQHELDIDLSSIVLGSHRLIETENGPPELYDLGEDPLEHRNLAAARPELLDTLRGKLGNAHQVAPRFPRTSRLPEGKPSEALLEHLQGIGYLGEK
jgi:arylsulfatase A-like enzyme